MREDSELKDLTLIKRLMALFKRRSSSYLQIALTDEEHVTLVNLLDWLGLLEDKDVKWLVEFSKRKAERRSVLKFDELTRLALSLADQDVAYLLEQYKRRIREVRI